MTTEFAPVNVLLGQYDIVRIGCTELEPEVGKHDEEEEDNCYFRTATGRS